MSAVKMGLTIEEAAECTGIGRNTMRKLVDWGKLPVLKVGRKAIIRRDTLERFMAVNQGRNLLREGDVRRVGASLNRILIIANAKGLLEVPELRRAMERNRELEVRIVDAYTKD